ncbi:hypothetical protein SUGI_0721420 [Cryptomeria japonica]|nr:hypothetical protein SUGI_0721420 [Cryptomeria japonica]
MWQSFDHPTDTLLSGQKLKVGQKLTAYISPPNTRKGIFYESLVAEGFAMFTATNPPQMYFIYPQSPTAVNFSFTLFHTNSLLYYSEGSTSVPLQSIFLYFMIPST